MAWQVARPRRLARAARDLTGASTARHFWRDPGRGGVGGSADAQDSTRPGPPRGHARVRRPRGARRQAPARHPLERWQRQGPPRWASRLGKKGKATAAFTGYTCKGKSGLGSASSNNPTGKVDENNRLTITYRAKGLTITFKVRFPTRTTAKGTITFKSKSCEAPKITFTAKVGVES